MCRRDVVIHNSTQESLQFRNADQGIYAQDSWTVGHFTINPGVRFEHFNGSIDARDVAPGRFVPARHFYPRPDLPNWWDVAPRLVAWDVQGTARLPSSSVALRAYSTGTLKPRSHFYTAAT